MRIVASARHTEPGPDAVRLHVRRDAMRTYRARLATLHVRAPDTLRARIRRELRAAAERAARR